MIVGVDPNVYNANWRFVIVAIVLHHDIVSRCDDQVLRLQVGGPAPNLGRPSEPYSYSSMSCMFGILDRGTHLVSNISGLSPPSV